MLVHNHRATNRDVSCPVDGTVTVHILLIISHTASTAGFRVVSNTRLVTDSNSAALTSFRRSDFQRDFFYCVRMYQRCVVVVVVVVVVLVVSAVCTRQ